MPMLCKAMLWLLLLGWSWVSWGQLSCVYQVELYDTKGDGWNGGQLTVNIVGSTAATFTLEDGDYQAFPVYLQDGDSLELVYQPGFFSFEAYYRLLDASGEEVYKGGQDGISGKVFATRVGCPVCPGLLVDSLRVEAIRHDRARLHWSPNDDDGIYQIYIVPKDEVPNLQQPAAIRSGTTYQVSGLQQHTFYHIFLSAICSNGDTTALIGPVSFRTLRAVDVGVDAIVSPRSGCDLGSTIPLRFSIRNYGGLVQSLIPVQYSVNGVPAQIMHPQDGVFTGVIGHGQQQMITLDAPIDLSIPGTYFIQAWTEQAGDQLSANDTASLLVIHTPRITDFPYAESFEQGDGGWRISDDSRNSSFEHGQPAANVIRQAAGGEYAWVTNLDGNYNRSELSYLLSPCLNLSGLEQDPVLTFSLFVITEHAFDGAWVEVSTDNGANWNKLGRQDTLGTFWYNLVDDKYGDWWSGENIFGNWRRVSYPMIGMAGQADVRIRMVFVSDPAVVREGIGLDDVLISIPLQHNLAATTLRNQATGDCGDANDRISLTIRNDGLSKQSNFSLAYQVNDEAVVIEPTELSLEPGKSLTYTFATPFRSDVPDRYTLRGWIINPQEQFTANDTAFFEYSALGLSPPYFADFEQVDPPDGWTFDDDFSIDDNHQTPNRVLYDNLYALDREFAATTPLIGPIQTSDSLYFDYRFVNFMGLGTQPKILQNGDSLIVEVSTDCGITFTPLLVIDQNNHQTRNTFTSRAISLADYHDQWLKIRFRAIWGQGDYYVDLDNINIKRCPADLQLQLTANDPSGGEANGSIAITAGAGIPPFRFQWQHGASGATLLGLAPGEYQVTVSDQQGCAEQIQLELGAMVATTEAPGWLQQARIVPNPTNGLSELWLQMDRSRPVVITILDVQGRLIRQYEYPPAGPVVTYPINIQQAPDGMYFIRLLSTGGRQTLRLLKVSP